MYAMKRLSDNFLTMLLPLTVVAATAFGLVAAVAFRMEATTAAFVFTALSIVGWIGLVIEFFLLYDIIIDKWLSKDRSVLTASWFVISLLLAFILTPDKHLDWSTVIVMVSLLPCFSCCPTSSGWLTGSRLSRGCSNGGTSSCRKNRKLQKNRPTAISKLYFQYPHHQCR